MDEKGRFVFAGARNGRRRVEIAGLGSEFYLSQVRYRGMAVRGPIFENTGDGELEIEIGRGPAYLSGTVVDADNKPVKNAEVMVARWPPEPIEDRDVVRYFPVDGDGRFQARNLIPGDYRVFAILVRDHDAAQEPAAWQRLTQNSERLTLGRADARDVTLKVSDPGR